MSTNYDMCCSSCVHALLNVDPYSGTSSYFSVWWYSTLASLTDCHWDSVVICREVLRPADHQKSAHPYVLRKWLLFWSDGVLVLVSPLGFIWWFLSYLLRRSIYTLLLSPHLIYMCGMNDSLTKIGLLLVVSQAVSQLLPHVLFQASIRIPNTNLSSLSLSYPIL